MAPTTRPDYKINLEGLPQLNSIGSGGGSRSANTSAANSPIEPPAGSGLSRYPLGNGLSNAASQAGTGRAGAGSPSKEYGSRLFPKRAREIQAQEGLTPPIWGPPTTGSGHSTPLRETIPESPGSDSFPDFDANSAQTGVAPSTSQTASRRARAGTVPSRFSPISSIRPSSSRNTPLGSPYLPGTPPGLGEQPGASSPAANAALLSRLRAGSMPQRVGLLGGSASLGNSAFASNWMAGRERASTLQSIRSSDGGLSSHGDSPADNDVRTLDYLGLVDTPQTGLGGLTQADMDMFLNQQRQNGGGATIADMLALNSFSKNPANRFRSYSVNATEKYADGDEEELGQYDQMQQMYSGQMTPTNEAAAAQAAAIHEAVRQHNLEVQAFVNFASANRPRARTAGVLDSPSRLTRSFMPVPSRLDNSMSAADLQAVDATDLAGLAKAVQGMKLKGKPSFETGLEASLESPTRSLWLGNIPSSTTVSSLSVIFGQFGPIESARVLTHKSCGFVNFENVQSAMTAKAQCNGKEIFPGSGPIRIGFAKEQSATNTPGANGLYPSPSPDPFVSKGGKFEGIVGGGAAATQPGANNINAETAAAALVTPDLLELKEEIYSIVAQFGASQEDQMRIGTTLETAMVNGQYADEIPPIPEPSHNRVHDAPRLREVRKRIDNNSCTPMDIESIAMDMLPEIAELASDYLGNTVVQKLFEHCSEETKDAMLSEIAPHLAEIGVHKNGTWAAQKIIDVARTQRQMGMIVDALSPHGVNLFLDQYGNYVMQCCLRFQAPMNNFIFDTMLNRLWEVAQGRFGARAMRACLESHFATNDQKKLMAAAITLHGVQLATNSNGALLLTWFLDTCTFPRRRSVLAPRLIPHLIHLCTHKVAYLTVLKIINQRNEPDARDSLLRALFFDEHTLQSIVGDQACGATFIFKVLTTPFLDDTIRPECIENVRNALLRLKAQPSQGYKRLMDEVGLSTRHGGGTPVSHDGRSHSKTRGLNGHLPGLDTSSQQGAYGRNNNTLQRTVSMDSNSASLVVDPYLSSLSQHNQQYTHSPAMSNSAGPSPIVNPMNPQLQYQQALLAQHQQHQQIPRPGPPGFYGGAGNLQGSGMSPYGAGSPVASQQQQQQQMMDPYRQSMNSSPMVPGYGPPQQQQSQGQQQQQQQQQAVGGYGGVPPPMMGMGGMNGYGHQYAMPPKMQQGQQQQQQQYMPQGQMAGNGGAGGGGGRRGRR